MALTDFGLLGVNERLDRNVKIQGLRNQQSQAVIQAATQAVGALGKRRAAEDAQKQQAIANDLAERQQVLQEQKFTAGQETAATALSDEKIFDMTSGMVKIRQGQDAETQQQLLDIGLDQAVKGGLISQEDADFMRIPGNFDAHAANLGIDTTPKGFEAVSPGGKVQADVQAAIDAGLSPEAITAIKNQKVSGQTINIDVDTGKKQLEKTVKTQVEKDLIKNEKNLGILLTIADEVRDLAPGFFTIQSRVRDVVGVAFDKFGQASEQQKEDIRIRTRFDNQVDQMFLAFKKDITGQAAAEAEMKQLKAAVLNKDQSEAQFNASLDLAIETGTVNSLALRSLLSRGITIASVGEVVFTSEFTQARQQVKKERQIEILNAEAQEAIDSGLDPEEVNKLLQQHIGIL